MCSLDKLYVINTHYYYSRKNNSCIAVIVMVVCHYSIMLFMTVTMFIVSDMFESYAYVTSTHNPAEHDLIGTCAVNAALRHRWCFC